MFHSNQKLEITRDLSQQNIKLVLDFVEKLYGDKPNAFQITSDNHFALGRIYNPVKGWTEFQFDYDSDYVSQVIYNHFKKHPVEKKYYGDGSHHEGFLVSSIEESFSDMSNGIIKPFYGIIVFSQYTTFYSK